MPGLGFEPRCPYGTAAFKAAASDRFRHPGARQCYAPPRARSVRLSLYPSLPHVDRNRTRRRAALGAAAVWLLARPVLAERRRWLPRCTSGSSISPRSRSASRPSRAASTSAWRARSRRCRRRPSRERERVHRAGDGAARRVRRAAEEVAREGRDERAAARAAASACVRRDPQGARDRRASRTRACARRPATSSARCAANPTRRGRWGEIQLSA